METIADHGGTMGSSRLAAESGLPIPTIHQLLRTLVDLGTCAKREPTYLLAPRLTRAGEGFGAMLNVRANPLLERLVHELGESASLVTLDGHESCTSRRCRRVEHPWPFI